MNDIVKKEQTARKFLKKAVHYDANNPSFFIYNLLKNGQGSLLNNLSSLDLKSKDTHDLVNNYLQALEILKKKISKLATASKLEDEFLSEFVSSTISNPLYFVPVDKIKEEKLDEILQKNLSIDEIVKQLKLNPSMYNLSLTITDSCLDD